MADPNSSRTWSVGRCRFIHILHVRRVVETSWTDDVHCQLWNWMGSHKHGSFVVVRDTKVGWSDNPDFCWYHDVVPPELFVRLWVHWLQAQLMACSTGQWIEVAWCCAVASICKIRFKGSRMLKGRPFVVSLMEASALPQRMLTTVHHTLLLFHGVNGNCFEF